VRRLAQRDRHEPEIAAPRPVRLRQQSARNIARMDDGDRLCHCGDGQFRCRSDAQPRAKCRGAKRALAAPPDSTDPVVDGRCFGLSSYNPPAARLRVVLFLLGALGSACTGPKPFLLQGDAGSAQVGYYGEIDGATLVARQHCAQYERVPRFLEAQENVAFFDCVRP
jgi:hypothetical protein